jgi:ribosomal protein S12 methylthiotransferase
MRRFGSSSAFLDLIDRIRALAPEAAIRSNVVVGFPGETAADVEELAAFLTAARLDVVGVFGYSDEDGTEGATLRDKIDAGEIADRVAELTDLVEELTAHRAAERIGSSIDVLIEELSAEDGLAIGRASIQGPDIDGQTTLPLTPDLAVGRIVAARVVGSEGVDLQALPR